MNQLPDKLSDCLELAIGDLEKVEADPRYIIQMGDWHDPQPGGRGCAVCLAGSVMAKSMGSSPAHELDPFGFPAHDCDRLLALNDLRNGDLEEALDTVGQFAPGGMADCIDVASYGDDPAQFKSDMRGIVTLLREHNL